MARLWDSETGQLLGAFEGHTGAVLDAKFHNGGSNVVTCSEDATIRIWDVRTLAQLSVLRGHTGRIYKLSLSADGSRLLSASADGTARIWDAKSGTLIMS
jgi:WD40 repeat protein